MTAYLKGSFSVHMNLTEEGRDNWDRIFAKKNDHVDKEEDCPYIGPPDIAKLMKCPGCGAETFTASVSQMQGSFMMQNLRCVKCGDGFMLEDQVPPGSKTGKEFGVTWETYLVDLETRLRVARDRAVEEDPTILDRIDGIEKKILAGVTEVVFLGGEEWIAVKKMIRRIMGRPLL